jgi:hypothetical protein
MGNSEATSKSNFSRQFNQWIRQLYSSSFFGGTFHTVVYELQKELKDCESVLDLGCGPSSPLQSCKGVKHSVGVEGFEPYLKRSQAAGIHTEYLNKQLQELDFAPGSFDAVMMIEVIEHLPEADGLALIKKAENWAKKKVIISSPNGFIAQKEVDSNPLQKHLSGWDYPTMKKLGYESRGLAGLKALRQEVQNDSMGDDLMTSIRLSPRPFWFVVATLSQLATYRAPGLAFGLFHVKKISD